MDIFVALGILIVRAPCLQLPCAGPTGGRRSTSKIAPSSGQTFATLVANAGPLDQVSDPRGDVRPLFEPQTGESDDYTPSTLPQGRGVVFTAHGESWASSTTGNRQEGIEVDLGRCAGPVDAIGGSLTLLVEPSEIDACAWWSVAAGCEIQDCSG